MFVIITRRLSRGSGLLELFGYFAVAVGLRQLQRGHAAIRRGVNVRACGEQRFDDIRVTVPGGIYQRGLSELVFRVHVGTAFQQSVDRLGASSRGGKY